MGSVNKVIVVGNLGADAELRHTPGGASLSKFSVAATEVWTDRNGQRQERTEWVRVVLWGKVAESLTPYLTKGKQVYVEGSLQTETYERDGVKRYTTQVKARQEVLLGGGQRREQHESEDEYAGEYQ